MPCLPGYNAASWEDSPVERPVADPTCARCTGESTGPGGAGSEIQSVWRCGAPAALWATSPFAEPTTRGGQQSTLAGSEALSVSSRAFIQQPRGGPRIRGRQGRHSPSWKLPVHRECGGTRARGGSQQKPLPFVPVPLSQTSLDPRSAVASARRGEGQRFSAARRRVVTRGSERGQFPEPSEREVGSRELRTPGMSPCDDPRGRMRPGARSFPVAGGGRGKGGAV